MNLPNSRGPRAVTLATTIAVTAVLTIATGCGPDEKDCKKRDKGAPTQNMPGNDDAQLAAFNKSVGGSSGGRGGTTSGGSKGGTTKGGVTAGHNDCEDGD
ncbi:MAG: hypothetical protein ACRDP3_19730 [Streptomyces sp.]|uniref:hypothetical protein n=1 Tax=Streptomyces sp. TaxID=1931 RepID=UPI003D6ACBD0